MRDYLSHPPHNRMKKILIIEDDLIVRTIYRRKFEMAGYKVETAEEGAAGLKIIPTFQPDIIQVDIMLPGIDGVEVIRQIRSWPEYRTVPILVLSSFYRPDLAQEAWKAGASKCVSKMDCTPNLALDLIEQLLSGESTGFMSKMGGISQPKGAAELRPSSSEPAAPKPIFLAPGALSGGAQAAPFVPVSPPPRPALPKRTTPGEATPSDPKSARQKPPKIKLSALDLPSPKKRHPLGLPPRAPRFPV